MKRRDIHRADELRREHNLPYEKALKHAVRRNISYLAAVEELVADQKKKGAA